MPKVFVQIFTLKFPLKFQHCFVFPCVFKLQLCVNFRYHQTVVSALQQRFHLDCFLCFHCKRPIANGLFHLEQGEPYCDEGMKYYQDSQTFRCKFVHDKLDSGLYCTLFRFTALFFAFFFAFSVACGIHFQFWFFVKHCLMKRVWCRILLWQPKVDRLSSRS